MMTPAAPPAEALLAIARRFGTPTYAYDVDRIREQVAAVRTCLPASTRLLYSLKANPSLGIAGLMADWGLGADVASAGEVVTAVAAGFPADRIFVSGPYKSPELLAQLPAPGTALLSVDSVSELALLAATKRPLRLVLRLRPDFPSAAVVDAGARSRFGIPFALLPDCRRLLASSALRVVGFHVFAGSQVLAAGEVARQLRAAADLCLRASAVLCLTPEVFNLGGGFGVPYAPAEAALELAQIGEELAALAERVHPATLMLELGRYLVAQAGWYLTAVVAHQQYHGRPAVVVDGGTHQRADLCGLGLSARATPPLILPDRRGPTQSTAVLGCLCLPADVMAEESTLPALALGDVLAFPNAGAYGLSASPALFLGHALPAEVAFAGTAVELLRSRPHETAVLTGQHALDQLGIPPTVARSAMR
jgi:diaminopimelate decarboxylase